MEADLKRLKLTWERDQEVYHEAVMQARSQVESLKINLDRLVVKALLDGQVSRYMSDPASTPAWSGTSP